MTELENLKQAYLTAAKVVAKFGEMYLPIFERLHRELQAFEKRNDMHSLALRAAQEEK